MLASSRPTRILVAIDRTEATPSILATAAATASRMHAPEIHLLHVIELGSPVQHAPMSPSELRRDARAFLDALATQLEGETKIPVVVHLVDGQPSASILEVAADVQAELIVVGTHGRAAISRFLLGSVSQSVIAQARCSVLVARETHYDPAVTIEPACPDCLEMRKATQGGTMWCERHATRHVHGHLLYETPASFGQGSMFIRGE